MLPQTCVYVCLTIKSEYNKHPQARNSVERKFIYYSETFRDDWDRRYRKIKVIIKIIIYTPKANSMCELPYNPLKTASLSKENSVKRKIWILRT